MPFDINRMIVESSIVFVSIFATIGLLIGATQEEVKWAFIYLGYMLYYSLPFILAAFWGTISILSHDSNRREAEVISKFAVVFFLTGLAMLAYLASAATQTALLPTHFVFLMAYQNVLLLELYVAGIFLLFPIITVWVLSKLKLSQKWRRMSMAIFLIVFLLGVWGMTVFGVNQRSYVAKTDSVFLSGEPDFELKSVNVTLETTDQVVVGIKTAQNRYSSCVFLDKTNYNLYTNSTTRADANTIGSDFGSDISLRLTIEAPGEYYLIMKSEYFAGSNVTFSIQVYRTDASVLGYGFLISVFGASIVIGILASEKHEDTHFVV